MPLHMMPTQRVSAACSSAEKLCVTRSTAAAFRTSSRSAGSTRSDSRGSSAAANASAGSLAFHDRDETRVERRLLQVIETDVVLDRVRETTEQIRVRHDLREALRKNGNRQRERPRHARKDVCLEREIVG